MLLRLEHNAIIYKYNKYIQVSGSLFYAFEYLAKVLEVNPSSNIRFYIIIPSNQKKDYLVKLRKLFQTKYPLLREYKDRLILDSYQKLVSAEQFSKLLKVNKLLNEAFSRIITCSSIEILKLKLNKVLFINYNSWLNTTYKADTTLIIQNRNINSLAQSDKIQELSDTSPNPNRVLLYELPEQKFPYSCGCMQYQYDLKLGTEYFLPKELFNKKYRTPKLTAGKPITNTTFDEFQKPSLFISVREQPLLNTRKIEYHQNFLKYDENCRIIIEARFYKIPIKIIKVETKELRTMSNFKLSMVPEDLPNDSSVTRLTSDIENYTMKSNDFIVGLMI